MPSSPAATAPRPALIDQAATNDQSCLRGTVIEESVTGKLWDAWWLASYLPLFGQVEVPWYFTGNFAIYNTLGYDPA